MEKDRQTKIIAIVALFIGVVTLTLGFATFSTRLIIQSKAIVTPDADSFKVVLSKEQNRELAGNVKPTGNGEEATISNEGDPTISGLKAKFMMPGQRVEYEFYAVNTGELDAFLNKIEFNNVSGQTTNKICTAGEGATDEYVQSACESIRVTVKVAEDDKACQTSTYEAHRLDKKTGEKVLVTIEYNRDGAYADGPFEAEFGNITLNYSTTDSETKNVPSCTDFETEIATGPFGIKGRTNIVDNDGDGQISKSDKVTLGTESFYVVSTDEATGTVNMLSEWNLNVGNNTVAGEVGMQNEACKALVFPDGRKYNCTIAFSSSNYWSGASTFPAWVYDDNVIIRPHVENYVNELKKLGYSSLTGRLIKYEELLELGCPTSGGNCSNPSWVKNTSFWTGSAFSSTGISYVDTNGTFSFYIAYGDNARFGVRPFITINASEI